MLRIIDTQFMIAPDTPERIILAMVAKTISIVCMISVFFFVLQKPLTVINMHAISDIMFPIKMFIFEK